MGRAYKIQWNETTRRTLSGLGEIMATTKECAAVFGVSEPTYLIFLDRHPEARDIVTSAQGRRTASLRRSQFKAADAGNPAMLIWLGKQHLGQRDKSDLAVSGSIDIGGAAASLDQKLARQIDAFAAPRADDGDQPSETAH